VALVSGKSGSFQVARSSVAPMVNQWKERVSNVKVYLTCHDFLLADRLVCP